MGNEGKNVLDYAEVRIMIVMENTAEITRV